MDFETIRINIAELLQTILFQNEFFYVDLWTIIHIFAGMILIWLLSIKRKNLMRFAWLFLLLVVWKFFEFFMYGVIQTSYFQEETFKDITTDIAAGFAGGVIMGIYLVFKKKKKKI